jgi:hypothetical protein
MKKVLLGLMLSLGFVASAAASDDGLVDLGNVTGSYFYLSPSHVKLISSGRYEAAVVDNTSTGLSMLFFTEYDCNRRTVTIVDTTVFEHSYLGGNILNRNTTRIPLQAKDINPNGPHGRALSIICGK